MNLQILLMVLIFCDLPWNLYILNDRVSVQFVKGRQDMNCYKICLASLAFVHYILQDVQPCELVLARLDRSCKIFHVLQESCKGLDDNLLILQDLAMQDRLAIFLADSARHLQVHASHFCMGLILLNW